MELRKLLLSVAVLVAMTGSAMAQEEAAAEPAAEGGEAAPAEATTTEASTEEVAADSGSSDKKISVALVLGYGLTLNDSKTGGENIYGLGFGVRGAYMITDKISLGLRFQYHLGYSVDVPGGEVSGNEMLIGLEAGYDVGLGDALTLRPKVGLGLAVAGGEATIASPLGGSVTVDNSTTDLYIEPSAALLYNLSDSMFLGGDLGLPIALHSSTILGLNIMLTGGMKF